MRDPAVEESEAFGLARFTGQLPQHLYTAGVHYLSEEGGRSRSCLEKRADKEFEEEVQQMWNQIWFL